MTSTEAGADIWHYALRLWKRPGVTSAALVLQDRHGVSVCLALAALWLAEQDITPDATLADMLVETAGDWEQQRIAPLRGLRRQASARADWADWKRALQDAELEAERLLLRELAVLVAQRPWPRGQSDRHAWLLLVLPDMAQCESLAQAVSALLAVCED
ncbi:TIGR02444 family protein [Isoalcanivorax indicus]|uniref:TIGR02444 family protein n=1 Tax=Isoalcanivorax indicus TaxID=2202653 RepID=UPI000DB9C5E2|nr:TIGR02444 family protein [Isoalcanivorax indicus]